MCGGNGASETARLIIVRSTDRARPPLRPDSSVVERHLGKMEVPGSIPGRGSDKPVSSEAGFFVCQFCLPIFFA